MSKGHSVQYLQKGNNILLSSWYPIDVGDKRHFKEDLLFTPSSFVKIINFNAQSTGPAADELHGKYSVHG